MELNLDKNNKVDSIFLEYNKIIKSKTWPHTKMI